MYPKKSVLNLDARYTISREYCGVAIPQWVVRFCGEWVDCAPTEDRAKELAREYDRARFAH
ncbi:MAG: hypothetical protein ACXW1D_00390 [Halobacteriota archaeon]